MAKRSRTDMSERQEEEALKDAVKRQLWATYSVGTPADKKQSKCSRTYLPGIDIKLYTDGRTALSKMRIHTVRPSDRPAPAVLMSLIPYTQSSRWHVFRAADWLIWHEKENEFPSFQAI